LSLLREICVTGLQQRGEFAVGKRMLRNYINGTVGFEELSKSSRR
jgi:hypothetical protein